MKKLNIAFIWHFHQPNYQKNYDSEFLLPWARLHATKDYLDMLKRMDKFPNLKLNFDFSPVLLTALQKYLLGVQDIHLKLLLKDVKEISDDEKIYILNNYFDLNYKNMVLKRQYFTELYNRRANAKELNLNMFSLQEYADIMANFNLLWIDSYFFCEYEDLRKLYEKEKNYTFEDRRKIYKIQLDIIRRILEEYKIYQDNGRIEISTSPYYHALIPLLMDFRGKEIKNYENLPSNFHGIEDAKEQVESAIKRYREFFGKNPNGMWLSEQCICPKSAELLAKSGIKWTVADEGILSKSLKKEFVRDFEGNLENPFELNINYKTKSKNSINILFSDSFFANLLNFVYGNYDSKAAANDMYDKIKVIQSKLQTSPVKNHILTIALDGENCWETYPDDGNIFLDTLYDLISNDETLNTVLVNDYIENNKAQTLDNLKQGSWIKRNFDLWIGEPTKNAAWLYLSSVREDFKQYSEKNLKHTRNLKEKEALCAKIECAKREIMIAEGSDWYWWYGEPNESKSDGIFDFLFREHLANVYSILSMQIPKYLTIPLTASPNRPLRNPLGKINPDLSALNSDISQWQNAGYIFIPDNPTSNLIRLIKNIHFGYDDKNLYFRFELNKNSTRLEYKNLQNTIAIYFIDKNAQYYSPIRFINRNENIYPILKKHFSTEAKLNFKNNGISSIKINKAINYGLYCQSIPKNSTINYKDTIEIKLSFKDLNIKSKDDVLICIIDSTNGLINEVYPQDVLIEL